MRDRIQCKELLLERGFAEASQNPFHFFKLLTDKTAFIVNLKERPDGVGVVYGVISTAVLWTEGDWAFFRQHGEADENCNLRFYKEIRTKEDEDAAADAINALYQEYLHTEKDELLLRVKALRKQFLQRITDFLKPLGFRKKGNQWRKMLNENIVLEFWADKSTYSDLYYFEVSVYSVLPSGRCYDHRADTKGTDIFDWKIVSESDKRFDWQLQSEEDLREVITRIYEQELKPFMKNDLAEMGKRPRVWGACSCPRTICENCWVEKNLWEAKDADLS